MAKRASGEGAISTEHKIEEFAEDLGGLLGTARAKAEGWLGQRQEIVKYLSEIRDTAAKLLAGLGHHAQEVVHRGRRGRPPGSQNHTALVVSKIRGSAATAGRKKRTMSAEARARISAAQKARWAKQRAGEASTR